MSDRSILRKLFPRGRFVKDEDGTCVLRARSRRWKEDHLFIQAPGRLLGVYYVGSPTRYLKRVSDYVVEHLKADGEGILHLRWAPDLSTLLKAFNKRQATGGFPARH